MSDIITRKAQLDDVSQVANLLIDFYNIGDLKEAKEIFLSEIKKGHKYLVACQKNRVVGLVTWLPHGLPKHGLFELDRICISSKLRGGGIGKLLKDALVTDAENWFLSKKAEIRKLYLLTHESNTSAHKFYEKVGFIHEATLKDHYYRGNDERVYSIFFN